jgi:hypothetical protein
MRDAIRMTPIALRTIALVGIAAVSACSPVASGVPQVVVDPLPGYLHLAAEPAKATVPVRIRYADPGHPGNLSTVYYDFAAGQPILVVAPSTPSAPGNLAILMNETQCVGSWPIESQVETDVVLHFDASSCRVEVIGSHPYGAIHTDAPTEPKVDGSSAT